MTAIIILNDHGLTKVWCGLYWGWYPLPAPSEAWPPAIIYDSVEKAEAQATILRALNLFFADNIKVAF